MDGDHKSPAGGAWQFKPDDGHVPENGEQPSAFAEPSPEKPAPRKDESVTWTASEFVAHDKTFKWYAGLAGVAVIAAALVFLATRDKISTGVVVFVAVILGIAAGHQPRVLTYHLDREGIKIGLKSYLYNDFKSFAVVDEGAFSSIMLLPMHRFMPAISIYYDPKDEENILTILGERLPLEAHSQDMVERLMSRIHF